MARLPQHEAMEVSEGGEVDTKSGECTTSAGIADDRLCAWHFCGSVSSATVILALRHSHRRAGAPVLMVFSGAKHVGRHALPLIATT